MGIGGKILKGSNCQCEWIYVFSSQFEYRKGVGNDGHLVIHSTYTNTGYLRKGEPHLGKKIHRAMAIFIIFSAIVQCLIYWLNIQ